MLQHNLEKTGGIVGYVFGYRKSEISCRIQEGIIRRYCEKEGLILERIFYDKEKCENRILEDRKRAERLGIKSSRCVPFFPSFEELLMYIKTGAVKTVIVESRYRLVSNNGCLEKLENLIRDQHIQIIEAGEYIEYDIPDNRKTVVYHRTFSNSVRNSVLSEFFDKMYEDSEIISKNQVSGIFVDDTLTRNKKWNLLVSKRPDIIVVKNYRVINRHTGAVIKELKKLKRMGIVVVSLDQKDFRFSIINGSEVGCNKERFAYFDSFGMENDCNYEIRQEIAMLYTKKKLNGSIDMKTYIDTEKSGTLMLSKLLEDSKRYDAVIVHSFRTIAADFNEFYTRIKMIGKPVYSIVEGIKLWVE